MLVGNHFQFFMKFVITKLITNLYSFDFILTESFSKLTTTILIVFDKNYHILIYK